MVRSTLALLLVAGFSQDAATTVQRLVSELKGASIERRDEIVSELAALGEEAMSAIRQAREAAAEDDTRGLLDRVIAEVVAAPLRKGVRVLHRRGDKLLRVDLETLKESTAAEGVDGYQRHPTDPAKVLFTSLEDLWIGDLKGNRKSLVHRPKLVHPGCGHIESSFQGATWAYGGEAVIYRVREVPEGVDPHEHSDDQFKDRIVKIDGTGDRDLGGRFGLHSDYHNVGLPDVSPDAKKAIASRATRRLDEGVEVELQQGTFGVKETRSVGKFELKILANLGGVWSPDSTKYFFYHSHKPEGGGRGEVYDLHLWDGEACTKVADARRLGLGGTGTYHLSWSPDSRKVAWLPDHDLKKATLAVYDIVTKKISTWTVEHASGPELGRPAWTPDSSFVAATSHRCPMEQFHQHRFVGCRPVLYLFDLAKPEARLVEVERLSSRPPESSAGGRHMYVFTVTAMTPKAKGEIWDEPAREELDLTAVDVRTGEVIPVTRRRLFPGVSGAEFERAER